MFGNTNELKRKIARIEQDLLDEKLNGEHEYRQKSRAQCDAADRRSRAEKRLDIIKQLQEEVRKLEWVNLSNSEKISKYEALKERYNDVLTELENTNNDWFSLSTQIKVEEQLNKELKFEIDTLKKANKVLSETQVTVDEWNTRIKELEISNQRLTTQDESNRETINSQKETIKELTKQVNELMKVITQFTTKDPIIVNPQVVTPNLIKPTVLNVKGE